MVGGSSILGMILLSVPFKVLAHIFLLPSFQTSRSASLGVWVQQEGLPDWIEALSCSCERVFSFVTSHDHGQST